MPLLVKELLCFWVWRRRRIRPGLGLADTRPAERGYDRPLRLVGVAPAAMFRGRLSLPIRGRTRREPWARWSLTLGARLGPSAGAPGPDPLPTFPNQAGTCGERQKAAIGATSSMRQVRSFGECVHNANIH
jgi:hypothetical protein